MGMGTLAWDMPKETCGNGPNMRRQADFIGQPSIYIGKPDATPTRDAE